MTQGRSMCPEVYLAWEQLVASPTFATISLSMEIWVLGWPSQTFRYSSGISLCWTWVLLTHALVP
jgi:hypothetical protein